MGSTTQSAINTIVQSPDIINIIKDIIIPFVSVLLGAFVGGLISYKFSLTLMKKNYQLELLKQAFSVIHHVSEAAFFLAINFDKDDYFIKFSEKITLFREFFSLKSNQNLVNNDMSTLIERMSEIDVQKGNTGIDFVNQCFELNHELDKLKKIVNDKITTTFKSGSKGCTIRGCTLNKGPSSIR